MADIHIRILFMLLFIPAGACLRQFGVGANAGRTCDWYSGDEEFAASWTESDLEAAGLKLPCHCHNDTALGRVVLVRTRQQCTASTPWRSSRCYWDSKHERCAPSMSKRIRRGADVIAKKDIAGWAADDGMFDMPEAGMTAGMRGKFLGYKESSCHWDQIGIAFRENGMACVFKNQTHNLETITLADKLRPSKYDDVCEVQALANIKDASRYSRWGLEKGKKYLVSFKSYYEKTKGLSFGGFRDDKQLSDETNKGKGLCEYGELPVEAGERGLISGDREGLFCCQGDGCMFESKALRFICVPYVDLTLLDITQRASLINGSKTCTWQGPHLGKPRSWSPIPNGQPLQSCDYDDYESDYD